MVRMATVAMTRLIAENSIYLEGGPGHGRTLAYNGDAGLYRIPILYPGFRRLRRYVKRGWMYADILKVRRMPYVSYKRTGRRLRDGRRVYKIVKVKS